MAKTIETIENNTSIITLTSAEMTALTAEFSAEIEGAQTEPNTTVLKSYTQQKAELKETLSKISDSDEGTVISEGEGKNYVEYGTTNDRWGAFCTYGQATNWAFSVNRTLLCGKKDGSVKGCGMTSAQFTDLSNQLTCLNALLLDYISADMKYKNAGTLSKAKETELRKLVARCENSAFAVLKAIKSVFRINTKCTRWDISMLAYASITIKYRDRSNVRAGYTFGHCSTMTLLNKVLRLDSAVKNETERVKALAESFDRQKVITTLNDSIKALTDSQ